MENIQMPSVGRVVHFVSNEDDGEHLAAIIVGVTPNTLPVVVDLQVFYNKKDRESVLYHNGVKHSENGKAPGTWHWPEKI